MTQSATALPDAEFYLYFDGRTPGNYLELQYDELAEVTGEDSEETVLWPIESQN